MDGLKNYLIAVCSAATLCAILKEIAGKGKTSGIAVQLMSGLFVTICIIAPWKDFSLKDLEMYNPLMSQGGSIYVETGKQMTQEQIDAIIIETTEAYILEKAKQLRLQVEVRVELSENSIPAKSIITGNLTQEEIEEMSAFLYQNIGIQKEMQIWR